MSGIELVRGPRLVANQLVVGEEVFPREFLAVGAAALTSGQLRLTFFTARKSEVTTQVRVWTGGTAAAATPTLARIGLYTHDADGGITRVAATASDTALFAATNTAYTPTWQTPYSKMVGQRYALGILMVSGTTMPNLGGQVLAYATEHGQAPMTAAVSGGHADLPTSLASAGMAANAIRAYGVVLP